MSGMIPLLLIYAFTAWTGKTTFNHLQCEEAGRFSWSVVRTDMEGTISMALWGHPTSLLAAPSRAPLNTHMSNCAALFRLPNKQLHNAISSPF